MSGPTLRHQVGWKTSALTHIVLLSVCVVVIYPLLLVVKIAFNEGRGVGTSLSPVPDHFTLTHFCALWNDISPDGVWLFGRQFLNSLIVAGVTTALGIFLACTAAYAFSRYRFPGVLTMVPLYILMEKLGLLDRLLGLVVVYATTAIPFCVWMLKGYFDTIPKELEESALIDGASMFTIFWKIILPLSMPAVAVTALFSFMTAWNEFVLAFIFINDPESFTLPVRIQRFVGEHDIQWGLFAASSIVVSVPVMALFYALQKHLVGGLTAGAVKG